ncbi:hypothetical protein SBOR_8519 [Sclerotinia borealis F-4128]|uniref:protein-ribulosamine 3-kinase n=1 Tax=Sclerotinia borealis (strain F-4128) TaxID=1432307 RepID=W9C5C8_SCLBF|nr:hypothetical protein SBOR_8519 [Sclerotinia borealis F-4128]
MSRPSAPDIHFFCCELINMTDEIPEMQAFTSALAELHLKGISPNGKYGFSVPTYKGTIPQYTDWHETWEESYYHSMKWFMYAEEKSQGVDKEMQELCQGILDKVIPRLLRPLETEGRQIQPRLIHGDLWAGNTSWNIDTNTPIIYDSAALYAHNEQMVAWRPIRHLTGKQYIKAYFHYFPVSAPEEDQDDRNMLYYLRWDLKSSALFSGNLRYRNMAKETMKTLIAKFPGGYEDANATTPRVFIARHGETEWTINGRSTGKAEIPPTANGIAQVQGTGEVLVGAGKLIDPSKLTHVFTSPRKRAVDTLSMLLGPSHKERLEQEKKITTTEDIAEWDYGNYEGLKPNEIRDSRAEKGRPWSHLARVYEKMASLCYGLSVPDDDGAGCCWYHEMHTTISGSLLFWLDSETGEEANTIVYAVASHEIL